MRVRILGRSPYRLILILVLGCFPQQLLATNTYHGLTLVDDTLGSTARALTKTGAGTLVYGIVGSKQMSDGTIGAMYWTVVVGPAGEEIFTDKYSRFAAELPQPFGLNAVATGIAFEDGDPDRPIICGFIGTDVTGTQNLGRAVIWRRNMSGQFTNTTLDDEAVQSRANALGRRDINDIYMVVGKYRLSNGDSHACFWTLSPEGIARTDLGSLGGTNSEAMAVSVVDDLIGWNIVGNADRSNGRTVATAWIVRLTGNGDLDWFGRALPTPAGAESTALYVGGASGGVWKVSGWNREPNGRMSASIWINQDETPSSFVSQVYRDVLGRRLETTASGIVGTGEEDILIAGTALNSRGVQRGVAALPFNQPFDGPFLFDFLKSNDPVLDWNSIALNAVDPSGAIAGQALVPGSSMPRAMLFVPTNDEVPQSFSLMVGNEFGDILPVWQQDGNGLRLGPRREGGVRSIMAEWTSTRVSNSARAPEKLTIVSRIMPRIMNSTGDLLFTLQLYDPEAMQWVTVAERTLSLGFYGTGIYRLLEIEIPNPQQFAVAGGEPLRWRTGLRGEEWRDWGIDFMEMKTMPVVP